MDLKAAAFIVANSLDPDQDQQNMVLDLDPISLT